LSQNFADASNGRPNGANTTTPANTAGQPAKQGGTAGLVKNATAAVKTLAGKRKTSSSSQYA